MTTPELEEYLKREEIDLDYTTTEDKYLKYLEEELGIHGGSLEVGKGVYHERYEFMPELGIRPFEWYRTLPSGEIYSETRYGITEYPGAWGYERMLSIGEMKADRAGLWTAREWFRIKAAELE